jgi:hypothetical protein
MVSILKAEPELVHTAAKLFDKPTPTLLIVPMATLRLRKGVCVVTITAQIL